MQNKLLPILLIVSSLFTIFSLWFYPTTAPILGAFILLISLALSIYTIFQTHKHTPNARTKIAKDILIFLVTFLLILFIGGVVGMLVNFYVSNFYGVVIGFMCAMLVCFAVGYLVRKGVSKLFFLKP